jgi:hypothetical protein
LATTNQGGSLVDVVTWVLLGTLAVYVGAVFYGMRKGMGEIITALESIDQRLARLEAALASREGTSHPTAEE